MNRRELTSQKIFFVLCFWASFAAGYLVFALSGHSSDPAQNLPPLVFSIVLTHFVPAILVSNFAAKSGASTLRSTLYFLLIFGSAVFSPFTLIVPIYFFFRMIWISRNIRPTPNVKVVEPTLQPRIEIQPAASIASKPSFRKTSALIEVLVVFVPVMIGLFFFATHFVRMNKTKSEIQSSNQKNESLAMSACSTTKEQLPKIQNIQLGMTENEFSTVTKGYHDDTFSWMPSRGERTFSKINAYPLSENYVSNVEFVDGHASRIWVAFEKDSELDIPSLIKFGAEHLDLPMGGWVHENNEGSELAKLTCRDFYIEVTGGGRDYPVIAIYDTKLNETLFERIAREPGVEVTSR